MSIRATISLCLGGLFLALGLSSPTPAQRVTQTNLVADSAGVAVNQDIFLIDAFGLARGTGTNWMVSSRGMALGIVYDGAGNAQFIDVNIPPAVAGGLAQPTGVVFNGASSFNVPGSTPPTPAQFLFATADGAIAAYNPTVDPSNAFIAVNKSATSSYTGLTIAEVTPGVFHLYAANFKKGRIEVFDGNFKPVAFESPCPEGESSEGLVPYNIQTLGRNLVITFAARGSNGQVVAGSGLVMIAGVKGNVLKILHDPSLNAPWGVAQAPADFGRLSHLVLIGNSGSGKISAFDPDRGRFVSFVEDSTGAAIVIDGLHALGFGASGAASGDVGIFNQASGPFNALYFTSGPRAGADGLLGNLIPNSSDFVLGEQ
jgi:uncharacterized protein (TIGR03118 family)